MVVDPGHFVKDHGIEALRRSTIPIDGYPTEYQIRTTGNFVPSGLQTSFLPTTMLVTDTAIALPVSPLADRNSIIIFNRDTTYSLFIGNADVTADSVVGTTSGWEIPPLSYFATDVKDTIIIYGICVSGQTIKVQVLEVA